MSITDKDLESLVGNTNRPTILEIGCNDGTDTRRFLKLWSEADVYCFEPDHRARARFDVPLRAHVELYPYAVGAKDAIVDFYRSDGNPTEDAARRYPLGWDFSGSIRKPKKHLKHYPWCTFGEPEQVLCVTLDRWAEARGVEAIDFIWMDVQGAEGDVIDGAAHTLARTRFLYTEYNNNEMYEGQPNLAALLLKLPGWMVIEKFADDVLLRNAAW